jgi:hypothetical protein
VTHITLRNNIPIILTFKKKPYDDDDEHGNHPSTSKNDAIISHV